jgi:hypothetical protein
VYKKKISYRLICIGRKKLNFCRSVKGRRVREAEKREREREGIEEWGGRKRRKEGELEVYKKCWDIDFETR